MWQYRQCQWQTVLTAEVMDVAVEAVPVADSTNSRSGGCGSTCSASGRQVDNISDTVTVARMPCGLCPPYEMGLRVSGFYFIWIDIYTISKRWTS